MVRPFLFGMAFLGLTGSYGLGWCQSQTNLLFPFVLPWDDACPSLTNLRSWNHRPAGRFGHVRAGKDGHLYIGKERVRFLGVNLCGPACFPRKEDAPKIAARMAKFGINIVRFHHMDSTWSPLINYRKGDSRHLNPEVLDRLDYFIAQLKKEGIYVNLNLLVSRLFLPGDGLPEEIQRLPWKERHIIGFFYEPILELQKEYARKLLTHRNPYTGLTYAEDPVVAFIEINNENGLIHAWLGGRVDRLPKVFLDDLRRRWNEWLRRRYGTTRWLRKAWGVRTEPLGEELLRNGGFQGKKINWVLERHGGAEAIVTVSDDVPLALQGKGFRSVQITVMKLGTERWHVQFNRRGLSLDPDRPYTLTFWAKADRPCTLQVAVMQAHSPWRNLGFYAPIRLTRRWQEFKFTFRLREGDPNARVNFTLGGQKATYWLAGLSLRPGGVIGLRDGERLEDGTVPILLRAQFWGKTEPALQDWARFLWETEDRYWQTLYRYLKRELKVKALVIGTIVGCSTPNMMAKLDCVDTHAYWCHPVFPFRPWHPEHWFVSNKTMVNERGGTLAGLAMRRVLGKPHSVSEYNHPAPNTYGSEAFLLLAAYGAFQDWDAIYAFSYSHRKDRWDLRRIPNYFDIDQHPTKMVTLIPAAAMFLRGDVRPAEGQIVVPLTLREELASLTKPASPWDLVHAGHLGVPPEATLVHRIAIAVGKKTLPPDALRPEKVSLRGNRFVSDTRELIWDLRDPGRGVITVDTGRTKAVIGYGGGKRFVLGGVVIAPGQTMQDGWCAITLTVMEGELPSRFPSALFGPVRLLITTTGYAQNTGWKLRGYGGDPKKLTLGRDWGKPPSLVEGIPVRIVLPLPAKSVKVWALDERGHKRSLIPVHPDGKGRAVIDLGPSWQTLWYAVEAGIFPRI